MHYGILHNGILLSNKNRVTPTLNKKSHNSESQKTDAEEYIVYDSISTKSQPGKINSVKNQQTYYPGRRG